MTDRTSPEVIGWIESVSLPELGLGAMMVKVDTGARTSALHATNIRTFERGDALWVAFDTDQGHGLSPDPIEAPVHETREIKNTSGVPEERIILRTRLQLGARRWRIDLSLTDRTNMTYPMILGRRALKNRNIAVDTKHTFVASDAPAEKKDRP